MIISEISKRPGRFVLNKVELQRIVEEDRLFPLLVRCGACRFVAAAQDIDHITKALTSSGDYVRDISIPAEG